MQVHPTWSWIGLGPPGSIQLDSGRILTPAYHTFGIRFNGQLTHGHTVLSDDFGETWRIGATQCVVAQYVHVYHHHPHATTMHGRTLTRMTTHSRAALRRLRRQARARPCARIYRARKVRQRDALQQ